MARLSGGIGTSLAGRGAGEFGGGPVGGADFAQERAWLGRFSPDIAVVIYCDEGPAFGPHYAPTFAVGIDATGPHAGAASPRALSLHLVNSLMGDEFDIAVSCHLSGPAGIAALFGGAGDARIPLVHVHLNAVREPLPSPSRCFAFGRSIGHAIATFPKDVGVVVIGISGLAGKHAGGAGSEFDAFFRQKLRQDPAELARLPAREIIRRAGPQGATYMTWLAMRGVMEAAGRPVGEEEGDRAMETGRARPLVFSSEPAARATPGHA